MLPGAKARTAGRATATAVALLVVGSGAAPAATLAVTSADDAGPGTLRQAILDANATPAADVVDFGIAGGGVHTIHVLSPLPVITAPLVIDGTTQPGYAGTPLVELAGDQVATPADGLRFAAGADGSRARALAVNRFTRNGIVIAADRVVISSSMVGTTTGGNAALGNGRDGVVLVAGASRALVGPGNVISGNARFGVAIAGRGATASVVRGNLIGTDGTGVVALPNAVGVGVFARASGNLIGGAVAGQRNVISGNATAGVLVAGAGTSGNRVVGDVIGVDASRAVALPNGDGVVVAAGAAKTAIGGTATGTGNLVSGNHGVGIRVAGPATSDTTIAGDRVGSDGGGTHALGNATGIVVSDGAVRTRIAGGVVAASDGAGIIVADPGTAGTVVAGTFVGTNRAGTASMANERGIVISGGATGTTVDGALVSGNTTFGIQVLGPATAGTVVRASTIGAVAGGGAPLGNGDVGVQVRGGAVGTRIGGRAKGDGNVIGGNANGVEVDDAGTARTSILGNRIGTNAAGTGPLGNEHFGVALLAGSTRTAVGGGAAGAGNVISGNGQSGVFVGDADTSATIQGNRIGTSASGAAAVGNGEDGVTIRQGAAGIVVGGTARGAGNTISGNGRVGVLLSSGATTGVRVLGNRIGIAAGADVAVPNALHGVAVTAGAHDNAIGGTVRGAGNRIAGNHGAGVLVGRDVDHNLNGAGGSGNAILGNAIWGNGGLGIDLGDVGTVTPNDPGDGDSGPNDLQNFPVLTGAIGLEGSGTVVSGTLNSAVGTYRVEVFASRTADPSGNGEGQVYLGAIVVSLASPTQSFSAIVPGIARTGWRVSATATSATGSTSEFSDTIAAR